MSKSKSGKGSMILVVGIMVGLPILHDISPALAMSLAVVVVVGMVALVVNSGDTDNQAPDDWC